MTHAYGDCLGVRYLTNGLKVGGARVLSGDLGFGTAGYWSTRAGHLYERHAAGAHAAEGAEVPRLGLALGMRGGR
mgnify:CR=1 FL=1